MANPFDQVANGYTAAKEDASKKPTTCPHCGQPTKQDEDEPLSKKIKKGLGLPDDGAAF